jgi:hypothetical protein
MLEPLPSSNECPPALNESDLYVRTLHRACEVVGGLAALARELQLRPNTVNRMLQGKVKISRRVFLAAVDIIARPA